MQIQGAILFVLSLLVAHYVIIELMARFRYVALILGVLALISTPLWFAKFDGWFYAVKIFSVWVPLFVFGLIKSLYPLSKKMKNWAKVFSRLAFFLLALNILEASLNGLQIGYTINALVGLLLIFVLPVISSSNWIAVDYKSRPFLIYAETSYVYILLYTSWNICFVYATFPQYFSIVLISLLYCFLHVYLAKSPNLWFSFRTFTLGLILMIRANTSWVESYVDWSFLFNEKVAYLWGGINLGCVLTYIYYQAKNNQSGHLIGKVIVLFK